MVRMTSTSAGGGLASIISGWIAGLMVQYGGWLVGGWQVCGWLVVGKCMVDRSLAGEHRLWHDKNTLQWVAPGLLESDPSLLVEKRLRGGCWAR